MDFGFTLKPEHSIERTIALTRQAEAAGFTYGWLFDSHVLWKDVYPLLTLMAVNTTTLRLGTCVTNPATRDITVTASVLATLDEISGGRMDLGIGRGDSAQRVLGRAPVRHARSTTRSRVIRDLVEGRATEYQEAELELTWTGRWKLPVWIAGYGPLVLGMAGRVADGVILQLAEVDLITLDGGHGSGRRAGGRAATPRPSGSRLQHQRMSAPSSSAVSVCAGSRRSSATMSSTSSTRIPRDQLPENLTGYIRDREGYDYLHHAEVGSDNARFVSDEVADRFSIVGPPEEHVRRLLELHDAGVDQFNLYLMNGDEEEQLEHLRTRGHPCAPGRPGRPCAQPDA